VIVIGCGKVKLDRRAPARELYTGSLFVAARRYAEASGQTWAILSAKHGLVGPHVELEPYDVVLKLGRVDLRDWALRAAAVCQLMLGQLPKGEGVEVLAGHPYAWPFRNELLWLADVTSTEPLEGLGIGQRLQWFKLNTRVFPHNQEVG